MHEIPGPICQNVQYTARSDDNHHFISQRQRLGHFEMQIGLKMQNNHI